MRCHYCEWRCELGAETFGVCKMYFSDGKTISERFPHRWCTFGVSGIESIPFYHVDPGSRCMTIGTSSCNFSCKYCSNAFIAKRDPAEMQQDMLDLSPGELVRTAQKLGCHSIVFNVNEPAVSLNSLHDVAEEARAAGIHMGCLTNGYTTPESTELLASIFSFFNISLKGLSPEFNREYIGIPSPAPILRTIKRLAKIRHVEVATPVIQGVNDHELDEMAGLIAAIDPEIPWHVFRLLPEHEMKDAMYPNIEAINEALVSARSKLFHIYFHNFVGSDWVNTLCPNCGATVVERFSLGCGGDKLQRYLCNDGQCPSCGRGIRMLGDNVVRNRQGAAA
ncbi:MAG: radical SAM protein [Desulfuromonadales bacterium]|nr:radical SAM protein [Desulfuromonadales bacterium]